MNKENIDSTESWKLVGECPMPSAVAIKAWVEIIEDLLGLVPFDKRQELLQLALATERDKKHPIRCLSEAEVKWLESKAGMRHRHTTMRLKGLIVEEFSGHLRRYVEDPAATGIIHFE